MVIQRWQSLLLLLSAAVMCCFSFCSLGQVQTADYTFNFTSLGFSQEGIPTDGKPAIVFHTWYFLVLSLTSAVIMLLDIFLFKNLALQKKVCVIGLLMVVASAATCACLAYGSFEGGEVSWTAVVICPLLSLILSAMAYGFMSRDQNRLRSADRIR